MVSHILLTGATGYIGGSLLADLAQNHDYSITVLVRKQEHADKITSVFRAVRPVIGSLEDLTLLEKLAAESDAVVDTASSWDLEAPRAFLAGLQKRKAGTGQETHYIHTSGTSVMGDTANGAYASERVYHDSEDIYAVERKLEAEQGTHPFRHADIITVDAGLEYGVKTYVVIPPTIFGKGTGLFNTSSHQVPNLVRAAVALKQAHHVGKGLAIWTHVHILDLVTFYTTLLRSAIANTAPCGRAGYYFAENGERSFKRLSDEIAHALVQTGFKTSPESVPFASDADASKWIAEGNEFIVHKCFGSNSRVRATRGRELGWSPVHTTEDLYKDLAREIKNALRAQ